MYTAILLTAYCTIIGPQRWWPPCRVRGLLKISSHWESVGFSRWLCKNASRRLCTWVSALQIKANRSAEKSHGEAVRCSSTEMRGLGLKPKVTAEATVKSVTQLQNNVTAKRRHKCGHIRRHVYFFVTVVSVIVEDFLGGLSQKVTTDEWFFFFFLVEPNAENSFSLFFFCCDT